MNWNNDMKKRGQIPDLDRPELKNLPFSVPASYFEELPGRIQERLAGVQERKRIRILPAFRPALATAAMFIGLIAIGYAGFRILSQRGQAPFLTGKELDETMEYFAYDVDDDMLVSALVESGISLSPQPEDPRTEEMIQVLSEEDLNANDLINY